MAVAGRTPMNHPHDRTSSIAGNNVKQRRHNNKNNTSTMPLSSSSPAVVTSTKKMKTPTYVEVPFWPEFHWRRIPHEENDVDLNSASFIGYIRICISQNNTNSRQYVYQSVETSDISIDDPCDSDQPSPLIRMNPGNHYRLILINHIDQSTNLHTHGLHISGIGIHDDITRSVDPGNCLVHEYRILDDADIGTFWYHAHRYPIAAEQVGNGAYGVLIVEPTKEQVQQLDYPIPLQQFLFNPTNQVILQYTSVRGDQSDPIPRNKGRTNWINGQTSTINLTWTKSKWYYVRLSTVVISDPINYFEAYPRQACEAHIIAYDGTYRSQIPSNISVHKHMMTASSRLDLAIRCYENATIHFHQKDMSRSSRMVDIRVVDQDFGSEKSHAVHDSANIAVPPSRYWDATTETQWESRRSYYTPNYLLDYDDDDTKNIVAWNMSMDNLQGQSGEKIVAINNHIWDPNTPLRSFRKNQIVELVLFGTERHPFHMHINHMQIVSKEDCGTSGRYEYGEFYDTITAPDGCRVRFQFWDFVGRVILHCHKLRHEDRGMMVWLNITEDDAADEKVSSRSKPPYLQGQAQEKCIS